MSILDKVIQKIDPALRFRKEDEDQLRSGIRQLLSTPEGRAFYTYLVSSICRTYKPCDSLGQADLAYAAGRRDAGLDVFALCRNVEPQLVQKAQAERERIVAERKLQHPAYERTNP